MPWSRLEDVPAQVRKHKDVPLTLEQANWVAEMADALEAEGKVDSPWAVAWAQFEKRYVVRGGRWVRRATEGSEVAMAEWSRAYINDLKDEDFLYVEPGGEKDETDRTVPRTLRHFPYRNAQGEIDLPHLRNAIARIPQSNLSADLKKRLQAKARRILAEELKRRGIETSEPVVYFDDEEVRALAEVQPEALACDGGEDAEALPQSWHPLVPVGRWHHPRYGVVEITPEDAQDFANNVKAGVRGQDIPVDELEGHRISTDGAYGWLKDVDLRDDGVWGLFEWTPPGAEAIRERRFKYISPVLHTRDKPYVDSQGNEVPCVVRSVALTNRPVFKGQPELQIAMSEYTPIDEGGDEMPEDVSAVEPDESVADTEPAAGERAEPAVQAAEEQETAVEAAEPDAGAEVTAEADAEPETDEAQQEPDDDAVEAAEEPVEAVETEESDSVSMAEFIAMQERLTELEREKAMRAAEDVFAGMEFGEYGQVEKARGVVRYTARLAPHAVELARDIYLALPDEMREKFVEFCDGGLDTMPLGEWGTSAIGMAEAGSIEKAIEKFDVAEDTKRRAVEFAEREKLTDPRDAQKAIDMAIKAQYGANI